MLGFGFGNVEVTCPHCGRTLYASDDDEAAAKLIHHLRTVHGLKGKSFTLTDKSGRHKGRKTFVEPRRDGSYNIYSDRKNKKKSKGLLGSSSLDLGF